MIHEYRSKVSDEPDRNYIIAVCDLCEARCEESRLPGRQGIKASQDADDIAKARGWAERSVSNRKPRSRKMSWTIQLVCPACQEKAVQVEATP